MGVRMKGGLLQGMNRAEIMVRTILISITRIDFIGGPRRIRTYDLLIKSQLLYRTEASGHASWLN